MSEPVPYLDIRAQLKPLRPQIDEVLLKTVDDCSFCLGPSVAEFERSFADYCGTKYAVGVNSGTSALHLALILAGVGEGDEVITTPMTFVATAWAISYVGAKPVFVDIHPDTWTLDPEKVEAAITSKTKAVIPVHLYGHPADMDPIAEICQKHGLQLIEDAAQSHGAIYKGDKIARHASMSCFSFYPGKNLGAVGEGGALVTNDEDLLKRAQALRNHGSYERYFHEEIGFNYRMEGIQGAVLSVKLPHLESWNGGRKKVSDTYHNLMNNPKVVLPAQADWAESVWHLFVVRVKEREAFIKHIEENKVGYGVHYPVPLHLQKCYAHLELGEGAFPVAENLAAECVSLPVFPELSETQVNRVVEVVNGF